MAQHAALHYRRENKNIRVNTVAPGAIKTQIIPSAWDKYLGRTDIFGEAVGEFVHLFRPATGSSMQEVLTACASDIANAVLFLASGESFHHVSSCHVLTSHMLDESKFVNAANITVDNALINDIPLDKFLAMGK